MPINALKMPVPDIEMSNDLGVLSIDSDSPKAKDYFAMPDNIILFKKYATLLATELLEGKWK